MSDAAAEASAVPSAVANLNIGAEVPTRVRYRVMFFLCVLSFLTYFDRACIVRASQDIRHDLLISEKQWGWVLGIFWFAYGLFEIPGGWLGDRYGSRVTLARIVLAWSLFTALSGTATGFLTLFFCRLCFGIGEAGAYPNMAAIQSRWVPSAQRARLGGMLWLFARWGAAASPIIFGALFRYVNSDPVRDFLHATPALNFIADAPAWRFGFWTAGILGVLWCVSFYPWFRNSPAESSAVNGAERALLPDAGKKHSHSATREVWRALFTSKSLWGLAIYYFCGGFAWSFFLSWAPLYMNDQYKVNFNDSEWMNAAPLFFGGISCLVGGAICDWLITHTGRKRLIRAALPICGCIVASSAMFGIRFAVSPMQAAVLLCIAAAAYDMGQSSNWASIVDIGGRHAGIAAGFINMIGNCAGFLQPTIGPYIREHYGWSGLFIVYAAAFLIAALMWFFINPEKTFEQEREERSVV